MSDLTTFINAQNENHGPWTDERDLVAAAHEQRARETGVCDDPTDAEIAHARTLIKTVPTGPLYLVEVRGANGSPARIGKWPEGIRVFTEGRTEWCPATVYPHDIPDDATSAQRDAHPRADYWTPDGKSHRRVALFTSARAAEMAVADGELWNGQTYRVRAARGEQLREGVVIDSYQAPHRPRRDPTAARVSRGMRCHPDTWQRIDAEAKRTGESAGQVIDRLAQTLPA